MEAISRDGRGWTRRLELRPLRGGSCALRGFGLDERNFPPTGCRTVRHGAILHAGPTQRGGVGVCRGGRRRRARCWGGPAGAGERVNVLAAFATQPWRPSAPPTLPRPRTPFRVHRRAAASPTASGWRDWPESPAWWCECREEKQIASLASQLDFTSIDEMDPSLGARGRGGVPVTSHARGRRCAHQAGSCRAVAPAPCMTRAAARRRAAEGHRIFYEREVPFELRSADGLDAPQASAPAKPHARVWALQRAGADAQRAPALR